MSSTLPATSNSLTSQQRERLMRSVGKIEQILGASPKFADSGDAGSDHSAATGSIVSFRGMCHPHKAGFDTRNFLSLVLAPMSKKRRYTSPHIRGLRPVLHLTTSKHSSNEHATESRHILYSRPECDHALTEETNEKPSKKFTQITKINKLRRRLGEDVPSNLLVQMGDAPVIVREGDIDFELVNPMPRRMSISSPEAAQFQHAVPTVTVTEYDESVSDSSSEGVEDASESESESTVASLASQVDEKFRFELPAGFQSKHHVQEEHSKLGAVKGWFKTLLSA